LIESETKRNFQRDLNAKDRMIDELRNELKGNTKVITEKHTQIIERFTHEKITLQTEINRLNQQILILKEAPQQPQKSDFAQIQGEKRKIYDKVWIILILIWVL
jgi:hypothetical protein